MSYHPTAKVSPTPLLVVSCSDARLTPEDASSAWRSRLGVDCPIFEVRCPGGGLAMADKKSAFYQSALESYILLSSRSKIREVVLAFHEDCAYFWDKYGHDSSGAAAELRRKWRIVDEAVINVRAWSGTLIVKPIYLSLSEPRDVDPEPVAPSYTINPSRNARRSALPFPPLPPLPAASPNQRATLRNFEQQVEERVISSGERFEDVLVEAVKQACEQGVTPVWRAEQRAREFIEMLRGEMRKPQSIKQLTRAFVVNYAGDSMPRSVLRSLLEELDIELRAPRARVGRT